MEFDDKFITLMELYKRLRRDPEKQDMAERAFEGASNLVNSGRVSKEAQEASRYI